MKISIFPILLLTFAACVFLACESNAAREQRMKAEADRAVAEEDQQRQDTTVHSEAVRALELEKQHQLDAVEQQRTGDVYAHSCRKAVGISPAMPVAVDTKGCTPEQLRLEQDAERRQMFDEAMKNAKEGKRD